MKNVTRILAIVLTVCIVLGGCKGDKKNDVVIGNYKEGFTYTKYDTTVTEEDINTAISKFLSENSYKVDVTDRGAGMGDTVVVDYQGLMDGVAFEGGTATDYEITSLLSGGFIDGFEEAIVGKETGESFSANLKFPDPYPNNPDYAGKDVVFNFTLKSIKTTATPEYNDETVKDYAGYDTTAQYEEYLEGELRAEKEYAALSNQEGELWTQLLAVCEVKSYPQADIDDYVEEMTSYFKMYAEMFQISYDEFIASYTTLGTAEEAEAYMIEEAKMMIKGSMIIAEIAKAEGLSYTEAEYTEFVNKAATANGMTPDEIVANYSEEEIAENIYYEKIMQIIRSHATEVSPS